MDNARAEVQMAQQRLDEFYRKKEAAEEENGFTDGNEDADNFGTGLEGLGEDFAAGDAIIAGKYFCRSRRHGKKPVRTDW